MPRNFQLLNKILSNNAYSFAGEQGAIAFFVFASQTCGQLICYLDSA